MTEISQSFQFLGILNILFWPGFIMDALTSDMMKISPELHNLDINLIPATK